MQAEVNPRVSVIIASHRSDYILRCVAAFGPHVWETVHTEIIVVADYPVEEYAERFPEILWLFHPDISIPAKRNAGVRRARGDIIAFIDDDCRPGERWISRAVDFLDNHPEVCGVEGMTRVETPAESPGPSFGQFKRLEQQGYRTNNIFYRRSVIYSAGMFDERFTVQREDLDLAFTLLTRGYAIAYHESLEVVHSYRTGERWDLLKNCARRRFDPLLHRKHPALYRRHVKSPFPPGILTLCACYCATAAVGIFGRHAVLLLLLVDTVMILILTARRCRGAAPAMVQWIRECIAYALSPVVLCAALMYGNVRFRTFLII